MDFWDVVVPLVCVGLVTFVLGATSFQNYLMSTYEKELKTQGNVIIKLNETRLECGEK